MSGCGAGHYGGEHLQHRVWRRWGCVCDGSGTCVAIEPQGLGRGLFKMVQYTIRRVVQWYTPPRTASASASASSSSSSHGVECVPTGPRHRELTAHTAHWLPVVGDGALAKVLLFCVYLVETLITLMIYRRRRILPHSSGFPMSPPESRRRTTERGRLHSLHKLPLPPRLWPAPLPKGVGGGQPD